MVLHHRRFKAPFDRVPDGIEPVDDVVTAIIAQNGSASKAAEYLGKANGHWIAVPTGYGSTLSPPCARIDLMKQFTGLDVTKMYPDPMGRQARFR